jgi:hypothetical protein
MTRRFRVELYVEPKAEEFEERDLPTGDLLPESIKEVVDAALELWHVSSLFAIAAIENVEEVSDRDDAD